jgi:hypothetical protein
METADNMVRSNDDLACDECGRFGAVDLGERKLCPDCYATGGSCCSGLGRETQDLEI